MHNKNNIKLIRIDFENKPSTRTPVNANNLNSLQNNIDELCQTMQDRLQGIMLWTNPNPASEFEAQNITLSSSDYDVLEVYYVDDITTSMMNTVKTKKGYGTNMSYMSDSSMRWWTRKIECVSDNELLISKCTLVIETKPLTDNAKCVPLYVVGYKIGLFNEVS